jgi:hypothetical protein
MKLKNLINYLLEKTAKGGEYWYHTTSPENAKLILQGGLRINPRGKGKSRASLQWMPEAYGGITPIFLSRKPGRYSNGVILKVDVSGLDLVADIPGLVDFDGRLTDHSIYWDEEETPEIIWDLMDPGTEESVNGELEFEWLREPDNDISRAAIELTGTAAVMQNIDPSRIELTEMIVENVNEAMETEPPEGYYVDISGNERVIRIRIKSKSGGRPKLAGMMNVGRGITVPAAEAHDGGLVWEVVNAEAEQGYGPMLYDLAMEMVLLVGGVGLMPDRTFVSPSARAVWAKYYNRGDIDKEPLPEDIFDFSDMRNRPDYMRYYYGKSGTPLMNSLKARGLLKSEDFDLD